MGDKDKYADWTEWNEENSKDLTFNDMLLPDFAIANLFNKGMLASPATARPYLEKALEIKALNSGLGNQFTIDFAGVKNLDETHWENEVAIRDKYHEIMDKVELEKMKSVIKQALSREGKEGEDIDKQ